MPDELSNVQWREILPEMQRPVKAVLAAATSPLRQCAIFEDRIERSIQNQVERLAYVPKLPIGGKGSDVIAKRLFRVARKVKGTERLGKGRDGNLALALLQFLA